MIKMVNSKRKKKSTLKGLKGPDGQILSSVFLFSILEFKFYIT